MPHFQEQTTLTVCWFLCRIPTPTIREAIAWDSTDEAPPREPGYRWQRQREAAQRKAWLGG